MWMPTHLSAIVPAANLTSVATAQVTVYTPAPGGGTSSMQAFFVTPANTTVTGQAVASGDGASATLDGRTATATGSGTLVVATYSGRPGRRDQLHGQRRIL